MPGLLMTLNPTRKRRRVRKMSALQRKYFGKRRGSKRKPRVIVATVNPTRRKRRASTRRRVVRDLGGRKGLRRVKMRRNPIRRRRARRMSFRRNPIGTNAIMGSVATGAIGAGGALALSVLLGNLPLPANMRTGMALDLVKIGGALLIGALGNAIGGRDVGQAMGGGAMAVTLFQIAQPMARQQFPNVQMARYVGMGKYLKGMSSRQMQIRRRSRLMGIAQRRARMVRKNGGVARVKGMGYIGPAKTLGRYLNR